MTSDTLTKHLHPKKPPRSEKRFLRILLCPRNHQTECCSHLQEDIFRSQETSFSYFHDSSTVVGTGKAPVTEMKKSAPPLPLPLKSGSETIHVEANDTPKSPHQHLQHQGSVRVQDNKGVYCAIPPKEHPEVDHFQIVIQ